MALTEGSYKGGMSPKKHSDADDKPPVAPPSLTPKMKPCLFVMLPIGYKEGTKDDFPELELGVLKISGMRKENVRFLAEYLKRRLHNIGERPADSFGHKPEDYYAIKFIPDAEIQIEKNEAL